MAGRVEGQDGVMTPSASNQRDTLISTQMASGLLAGTQILTLNGIMPVEDIAEGDRVITRDTGMARVLGVETLSLKTEAIWVAAGSLGHCRPEEDTVLPANQSLLLRDWRAEAIYGTSQATVPASRLVDGEFIKSLGVKKLTLYRLIFDCPHVIYAGGLEMVSHTTSFEC